MRDESVLDWGGNSNLLDNTPNRIGNVRLGPARTGQFRPILSDLKIPLDKCRQVCYTVFSQTDKGENDERLG